MDTSHQSVALVDNIFVGDGYTSPELEIPATSRLQLGGVPRRVRVVASNTGAPIRCRLTLDSATPFLVREPS